MEDTTIKNKIEFYIDSAKATRLYELLLTKYSDFKEIKDDEVEIEELNNLDDGDESIQYIYKTAKKKDEKISSNNFTRAIKLSIKTLISTIEYELMKHKKLITTNILQKLSCYYYLFKINTAKEQNIENNYIKQIEEAIDKIFENEENKKNYYEILGLIFQLNKDISENIYEVNKAEKLDRYYKIVSLLDEEFFLMNLKQYMERKKILFHQYGITLPNFKSEDLFKNLKQIHNILDILKRAESFKTNERFEYFHAFKGKNEMLSDVNYVLYKLGKKIFISLDRNDDETLTEAINYSLNLADNSIIQKAKETGLIENMFKTLQEAKNSKEEINKENIKLKSDYEKLNSVHEKLNSVHEKLISDHAKLISDHAKLISDHENLKNNYKALINKSTKAEIDLEEKIITFEKQISTLRRQLVESRTESNIKSTMIENANKSLEKKEEILERITYRDVGSKIITFFSCSQPESLKKELEKNDISPRNINKISEYIESKLKNYNEFMKKNGIDLKKVLKEIKNKKKVYDYMVHDKKKNLKRYIELISVNNKDIGPKIEFIFQNSKLMMEYVFEKDNNIQESEIFNEFKDMDEAIKKRNEEDSKKAKEC